ncbi:galactose-1-phosphate uridylyltransferase [bacterium]|nr:galactose-1-phosphate uridylyltransferase [bacterium]
MPEFRKDPITNSWIIIATERSRRPYDYREKVENNVKYVSKENCPFCPGHENMTPNEIFSYRAPENNMSSWWVRGFPAHSPLLHIEGEFEHKGFGIYDSITGLGAHEIIVETPDHDTTLGTMSSNQVEKILWAYRDRIIDLKNDKRFRYVLIFKNHGKKAGASSIHHPHSQVIALPIVPKKIKEELEGARFHYKIKERCIFCDIIKQELKLDERVIWKGKHFILLSPWAPRFPFETWILPLKHSHDFTTISKEEILELSQLMKRFFRTLQKILANDFSFNLLLHDTPNLIPQEGYWTTIRSDFHWHFEIIPRIVNITGFEWGTGVYINHLPPEIATQEIKKAF